MGTPARDGGFAHGLLPRTTRPKLRRMAKGRKAIYAAIVGNALIAVTKFIAAAITGSSAMVSEGVHSLVDTGNGGLLLVGLRRAKRPPDEAHPFGYGKEVYFWTLLVAMLIFAGGGGVSLYEGIEHIRHPSPTGDPTVAFIVLAFAFVFEGAALTVAWKEFRTSKGSRTTWQAIRAGKDPTAFAVLLEDSAALAGIVTAGLGIGLARLLDAPVLDGVASVVIGLILAGVAIVLASETRQLLIGEAARSSVQEAIRHIAITDDDVTDVVRLLTMHLGPEDLLVNLDVRFRRGLDVAGVSDAVRRLEKRIKGEHPSVRYLFIEAAALSAAAQEAR